MNILLVYIKNQNLEVLTSVKKILKNHDVTPIERDALKNNHYNDKNLVVVIGGDGTFLRASHFNKETPMFGINPTPSTKEGFFMQADKNDFQNKLNEVLEGKYKLSKLQRLEIKINGKKIPEYCLNEVYVGDVKPYNMFNYIISVNGREEFQRSSGILIGTAAGSHAWLKSATGKVMDIEEEKFQYIARELYEGRITKTYKLRKGVLKESHVIEIAPKNPGILVIDSISTEYKVKENDKIRITTSKEKLNYVSF
ncbi:MAG: NAD(+)/NADH kinase [Nanoarchaeota archaeon]